MNERMLTTAAFMTNRPGADEVTSTGTEDPQITIARLHQLLEINRLIVGTRDAGEVLDLVVDRAVELVGADAVLLLLDDGTGRARVASYRGLDPERAAAFAAPLDEHIGAAIAALADAEPTAALVAVPIVVSGGIDGILAALRRAPRRFDPVHELLLSALTDQAAIATGNAESYQRLYARERAARESAERAVTSRNELLAMVSHDLRNPLSTVSMSATLLLTGLAGQDSAPLRKQAERIQRSVQQMLRLVDDLLDVATIEAGTFALVRTPHPVATLVREAIDGSQGAASERGLSLCPSLPDDGLVIACDRERVLQVLVNLIGNAIKFTPRGGAIEVKAERSGEQAVFSVKDSGPGIAPDHLARVFDRYWQAGQRGQQGAGLGLFIARSLVEAHGGKLWAESEVGAGSTFSFAIAALPG